MKQKSTLQQQLYTIAFVDLSIKNILDSSSLFQRPEWMDTLFLLIFFGCMGWKFLLQRYTKPMLAGTVVFGALFAFVSFRMSYFFLLFTFCGVAGLQDVDLKKVLRYTSVTKILMILLHVIPYIVTAIVSPEDIVYVYRNGVQRQFFYIGHPNTFSMYVGWALLEFTYAYYERLNRYHLCFIWFINFVVYQFTDSNTSLIVATLCLISFLLEKKKPQWIAKVYTPIARYGYLVCSIFFSIITIWFTRMPAVLKEMYYVLNDFFTGRLLFGSFTYEQFGIAWLGNPSVALRQKTFFEGYWIDTLVYDNTYIYLLVKYGALFLPIFSVAIILAEKDKEKDTKRNIEKILVIAYTFFAIMENYSINAVLCFPILFVGERLFIVYEAKRQKRTDEKNQSKTACVIGDKNECNVECSDTSL